MSANDPAPVAKVLPEVYVERPRCPVCLSTQLRVYGTLDQGDGSLLRYTFCRACGLKFKVIAE